MKKRVRKKKLLREFRYFGFNIEANFKENSNFHKFVDDFLNLIEPKNIYFGGEYAKNEIFGVVEMGYIKDIDKKDYELIKNWLENREEIENLKIGVLRDLSILEN